MKQLQKFKDYTAEGPQDPSVSGKSSMGQLELIQSSGVSELRSDPKRKQFLTIDDLVERAQELLSGLKS